MRLQTAISLRFGGPGSGCNPAVAEPRCGRPATGSEQWRTGSRDFSLPDGRRITVPYNPDEADKVLAKIREEEFAKLPKAVQEGFNQGKSTQEMFSRDGVWDAKRVIDVHGPIKAEYLTGLEPQANPKMVIVAGGTASGKSSAAQDALESVGKNNAMYMNSDDIRSMLPETGAFVGNDKNGMLHEEAGYLRDKILADAIGSGYNMVIDAPGSNDIADFADKAEKQGYQVSVSYVHRDVGTAAQGAIRRKYFADMLSDLREVPTEITYKSHNKARSALERLSAGRALQVYDREPDFTKKRSIVFSRDAQGNIDWSRYNRERVEAISHGQDKRVPEIPDSVFE